MSSKKLFDISVSFSFKVSDVINSPRSDIDFFFIREDSVFMSSAKL